MPQKSQTNGISTSILGVVDVKRTKILEKRTFGGFATQKSFMTMRAVLPPLDPNGKLDVGML